jgi:hypothetical protein
MKNECEPKRQNAKSGAAHGVVDRSAIAASPFKCSTHDCWLVPAKLYYIVRGQMRKLDYFICPTDGCEYARANKWQKRKNTKCSVV